MENSLRDKAIFAIKQPKKIIINTSENEVEAEPYDLIDDLNAVRLLFYHLKENRWVALKFDIIKEIKILDDSFTRREYEKNSNWITLI